MTTKAIMRTPFKERLVTAADLAKPVANSKEPKPSAGNPRPCAMDCGMPAAFGDIYCIDCRSGISRGE